MSESFVPLVALIIVVSLILVFGILAASLVLKDDNETSSNTNQLLSGIFSFYESLDPSSHVTTDGLTGGSNLIVSNSTVKDCNGYRWTYNQNDQTLEWGLNPIDTSDSEKLVVTSMMVSGTSIVLEEKGTPGATNQWVYNENNQTWCLVSNSNLCMYSGANNLTLRTYDSTDLSFNWIITESLTPPACVQNIVNL